MKRVLRRPSPSMVVALVALFVALGGTGYAALTITGGNVKNSSLTGRDVKNSSLTGRDMKNNSVRSADVAGLLASDFKAGQLAGGPQGPPGPPGSDAQFNGAAAGGDLTGSYPNPTLKPGAVNGTDVQNGSLGTVEFASSIPAARVTRSGPQSIEDSVTTFIEFDSERYDTAAVHANATNNTRLTAPVDGIYAVTAQISWPFDPDGHRQLEMVKNGTTTIGFDAAEPVDATALQVTTQLRLQAGEFVGARVFQDSGGFLSVAKSDEWSPELAMTWLAPG